MITKTGIGGVGRGVGGGRGEGARKLRKSEIKLMWLVVGGGMRGFW